MSLISHTQASSAQLSAGEIHVYVLAFGDTANVPADRLGSQLSTEERNRCARFVFQRDSRIFLLSHCLMRQVLSTYSGLPPLDLEFRLNEYGKPFPLSRQCPYFSLSHTDGMAAIGVATEPEIGVDVEDTTRTGDWMSLSRSVLSAEEQRGLEDVMPGQERFYEIWTLKEAYIKARGMGLSLPLEDFSIRWDDIGDIGIEFHKPNDSQPEEWQFALYPAGNFRVAVAARGRKRRVNFYDVSIEQLLAGKAGIAF
jgi:4'-phosphopantetheinyl transferase